MKKLAELGQSVWLDFLDRDLLRSGKLQRLVDAGLRGLTSNPTIFEKALASGSAYDDDLRHESAETDSARVLEHVMVRDLTAACDQLRPVYDATNGADGFASIEVSPLLASDTTGTSAEVKRLWHAVGRPNLMVKIPGTAAGVPAIERSLDQGINVNITLLFSVERYLDVAEAYLRALESRIARGEPIDRVASVASFFVSRVDTEVDTALEKVASDPGERGRRAQALTGRIAIANARMAYADYERIVGSDRFRKLAEKGARPQRLLWASTTPKNPAYSPLHYVASLVGKETIDTMTEETIGALAEQSGALRGAVAEGRDQAQRELADLKALGIDLGAIATKLEEEGARLFSASFEKAIRGISAKRRTAA